MAIAKRLGRYAGISALAAGLATAFPGSIRGSNEFAEGEGPYTTGRPYFNTTPPETAVEGDDFKYDADLIVKPPRRRKDGTLKVSYKPFYMLGQAPEGMTINNETGDIEWKIPYGKAGTYTVEIVGRMDKIIYKNGNPVKRKEGKGRNAPRQEFTLVVQEVDGNYRIQVFDENGNPAGNVPISIYPASIFDPVTGAGDMSILEPKRWPEGYTRKDGTINLPLAGQSHIVVGTGTERLFNRIPGEIVAGPGETAETVCNADVQCHGVNAGGYIEHQETPSIHGNKYCVGDPLHMAVFGVNQTSSDQTITYSVRYHGSGGNPANAVEVFRGNLSDPAQSLSIPAGKKAHTVLRWTIGSNLVGKYGKYSIDIIWPGYDKDNDGTPDPWHQIGIFFLVPDTTPPEVLAFPGPSPFTNEPYSLWVKVKDPAQPGTVRQTMGIASGSGGEYYIDTDADNDHPYDPNVPNSGNGIPDDDFEIKSSAYPVTIPAYGEVVVSGDSTQTGKNAKRWAIKVWAKDASGNFGNSANHPNSVNFIDVHLTKNEADELADPIYDAFKIGAKDDYWNYFTDFDKWQSAAALPHWVLCNKHNDSYQVGHNYNGQGGLTEQQAAADEYVIEHVLGPPFAKPIPRCTKAAFVETLTNYLQYLKDHNRLPP